MTNPIASGRYRPYSTNLKNNINKFLVKFFSTNTINKIIYKNIKKPTLNIISTLFLSEDKLFNKDKMFHPVIANISIKRDDELSITDDNLKLILFRLYSLGYNKFNIFLFSKDYTIEHNVIDIKDLLIKIDNTFQLLGKANPVGRLEKDEEEEE